MPSRNFRINDKLEWGEDATFVPNKFLPVYNWFYYKEGYSRGMVLKTLEMLKLDSRLRAGKGFLLDPFCGVGTTNLACRELGINSVGFDVSPLALLAAKVKCGNYNVAKLKETLDSLRQARFEANDKSWIPGDVARFFNPHTLDDIVFFGKQVARIQDGEIREFFRLGLISTATRCSYMFKDGSVVKLRKHHVPPFRKVYFAHMKRMIHDVRKLKAKKCKTIIVEGDARAIRLEDNSIDCVITSPPYLNKIEYTKIYRAEEFLFFGGRDAKDHGVRSYIGVHSDDEPVFPDLPSPANAYFSDMNRVMRELYRVCKPGAKLAIMVGNGCFPDRVVDSDILISELAEKAEFRVNNILVLNRRWCTRQRVIKVGELRESMIVLEK
jgi:DNA modification methylase